MTSKPQETSWATPPLIPGGRVSFMSGGGASSFVWLWAAATLPPDLPNSELCVVFPGIFRTPAEVRGFHERGRGPAPGHGPSLATVLLAVTVQGRTVLDDTSVLPVQPLHEVGAENGSNLGLLHEQDGVLAVDDAGEEAGRVDEDKVTGGELGDLGPHCDDTPDDGLDATGAIGHGDDLRHLVLLADTDEGLVADRAHVGGAQNPRCLAEVLVYELRHRSLLCSDVPTPPPLGTTRSSDRGATPGLGVPW